MTTLPQTTAIRMPRPQGPIQGGTASTSLALSASGAGMTLSDITRVLRTNVWLIVGMLFASIAIGLVSNKLLEQKMPRYTAGGSIQIVNPQPLLSQGNSVSQNSDVNLSVDQKTQAAMLQDDSLLTKVLQNPNSDLRKTAWYGKFSSLQEVKADFIDNYKVLPIPETRLIKVMFTCTKAKDAQQIVNEIVDTHLQTQREASFDQLRERSLQLNAQKVKYTMHLRELKDELSDRRAKLNIDGGGLGHVAIKELELSELVKAQTDLQLNLQRARAQYDYVIRQIQSGNDPSMVNEHVDGNADVRLLKQQIDNMEMGMAQLLERAFPTSPQVISMQNAKDLYQKKLDDLTADLRSKMRLQVIDQLKQTTDTATADLEIINNRVIQLKSDLGELSNRMAEYMVLVEEEKGVRDYLKRIEDQLDSANASQLKNVETKVVWYARPELPTNRSFPKIEWVMTLAIASGLALSLGIAFLRELLDTSVRTPRDIERIGQMRMLGMVADESDDPQAAGSRLPLVIFDAPHSVTAEQLRQVRTRLQHTASLDTTRSIMVTSPAPGDGKTTIACNLAAGLALNGRRILLVDANFRRPEIHRIFAMGNGHGFSDVLNGSMPFEQLVQETPVPNLAVMTSGPKPINATEMFESQLLIDFIERALEEFDHVIFDSGPMMVVSESAAMAPRVDGVVTVVRARSNSRGLLQRMCEDMRRNKAEQLGVVLNAVRVHGGGYYGRNIKTYYEYQS